MKIWITLAVAITAVTGITAEGRCMMLGWKGGVAKDAVKWVKGNYVRSGNMGTLTYDWKNGSMTGAIGGNGKTFSGTWKQDGSKGGTFGFDEPSAGAETKGWWSGSGETKKNALMVKSCK